MAEFSIERVINIDVSLPERGLQPFNTSNLAIITDDTAGAGFSGSKIYFDTDEIRDDFGDTSRTYQMAQSVFLQSPNILSANGALIVIKKNAGETLVQAINRTRSSVNYFGVLSTEIESETDGLNAAAAIQSISPPKILGLVSRTPTDLDENGYLDLLRVRNLNRTRGLFYQSATDVGALRYSAAYFGRALSTNFNGINTVQTMHLKTLTGIDPDSVISTENFIKADNAGVDVYVSFQGYNGVSSSGNNQFFDEVYNLEWLRSEIQVRLFNNLAGTARKIPQTEEGMDTLKGTVYRVFNQGVLNGYIAPGEWTSPNTFGDVNNFHRAIREVGFYIYSLPFSQQSQDFRNARLAPLIQTAVKEAGAIHKGNLRININ